MGVCNIGKKSKADDELIEVKYPAAELRGILKQAVGFLEIFMPKTLAKRFAAIILLAIGVPVKTAASLAGLSEKSRLFCTLGRSISGKPRSRSIRSIFEETKIAMACWAVPAA